MTVAVTGVPGAVDAVGEAGTSATAIAGNVPGAELAASRRRIVAASDEARRRIERNLHDGTQQRLVSLALALRAAEAHVPSDLGDLRSGLSQIAAELDDAIRELQEIARGIHPANLSRGGLAPALRTLARRSPIPVDVKVVIEGRLPEPVEVAAYYVASEALANAAKHSHASRVAITLEPRRDNAVLTVRDDGVGGVDLAKGSGLVGLADRVHALGGLIDIRSAVGRGTLIRIEIPTARSSVATDENEPRRVRPHPRPSATASSMLPHTPAPGASAWTPPGPGPPTCSTPSTASTPDSARGHSQCRSGPPPTPDSEPATGNPG